MRQVVLAGIVALTGLSSCASGPLNARVPDACTGVGQTQGGDCARSVAPAKGLGMSSVQQRNAAVSNSLNN